MSDSDLEAKDVSISQGDLVSMSDLNHEALVYVYLGSSDTGERQINARKMRAGDPAYLESIWRHHWYGTDGLWFTYGMTVDPIEDSELSLLYKKSQSLEE